MAPLLKAWGSAGGQSLAALMHQGLGLGFRGLEGGYQRTSLKVATGLLWQCMSLQQIWRGQEVQKLEFEPWANGNGW